MSGTEVELGEVLTWPQALVGAIIVIVVMGLPQLFTYLNSKTAKKQVTNNGGSSMKDAVDRIEKKTDAGNKLLDEHLKEAVQRDSIVDGRLARVEAFIEFTTKKGGDDGTST